MAEGMLSGIIGDEDEKPEVAAAEPLAGAEAFAAAVAAKLAGNDPEVARDTSTFLKKQARLLDIQAEHLKDEHPARLHFLRGQAREVDIRRLGLRLRVGFQIIIASAATALGLGAAIMVHDALTSRRVVVDAFEAPPALAARGVSGTVLAGGVLDELSRMRSASRTSVAAKRDLSSAWANEVKVSIPDSGISLSELSRILRERFGHDIHIGGDLVETTDGGLALTVRGDGVAPKTFMGREDSLHDLTVEAAQYVYAESQPVLWAIYLENEFRYADEVAFVKSVYTEVAPEDRPYLLNSWANAESNIRGNSREIARLYEEAIKLKPDYWVSYSNLITTMAQMGEEEEAWQVRQRMLSAAADLKGLRSGGDSLVSDYQAALRNQVADTDANGGLGTTDSSVGPSIAVTEILLHDTAAAEFALQTSKYDPRDPAGPVTMRFARGLLALETGDAAKAVSELEAVQASLGNPLIDSNIPQNTLCELGIALEAVGNQNKADAAIKAGGHVLDCYRFRGDILDGRGDSASAQKAYADAVALAPDLPAAYFSWGAALAKHGDLAAAEAKLRDANKRGPHWADPLKAWGDVLVRRDKPKEALAKYEEALKYAPNWKELKEAREALLKVSR